MAYTEVLLLYPLPPDFITADTALASRTNSLDRDCTSLAVSSDGATTAATAESVDKEVGNDYTH